MGDRLHNWVEFFLRSIEDSSIRDFLRLCSIGAGFRSKSSHWEAFSELGAIHLLVLSGAHAQYFLRHLSNFLMALVGYLKLPKALYFSGLALGLWSYLDAANYGPALVRATLCFVALRYWTALRSSWVLLGVLCLQLIFFPESYGKLGFILSWSCFLMLLWAQGNVSSTFLRIVILSVFSQLLIAICRPGGELAWELWPRAFLANFLLMTIMDRFFLPFLGLFLGMSLFLSCLPEFLWPGAMHLQVLAFSPVLFMGAKFVSLAAELFRTL